MRHTVPDLENMSMTKKNAPLLTVGKRKSRFKKSPEAPKRFKSAYIFFSTAMMQQLKDEQKANGDKKKITDISKHISTEWKNLSKEERTKWIQIASQDKERFLEEKRNYKGQWQILSKQRKGKYESPEESISNQSVQSEADNSNYLSSNIFYPVQETGVSSNERASTTVKDCNDARDDIADTSLQRSHLCSVSKMDEEAARNLVDLLQYNHVEKKRACPTRHPDETGSDAVANHPMNGNGYDTKLSFYAKFGNYYGQYGMAQSHAYTQQSHSRYTQPYYAKPKVGCSYIAHPSVTPPDSYHENKNRNFMQASSSSQYFLPIKDYETHTLQSCYGSSSSSYYAV